MSLEGTHSNPGSNNNVQNATEFAFDAIREGVHNDNVSEVVTNVDRQLAHSGLSSQEKLEVSRSLADKLEDSGLLPRIVVDYSIEQFDTLANGDKHIGFHDRNSALRNGVESTSPVKGMITRQLDQNHDEIGMSHHDSLATSKPRTAAEFAKGISRNDLQTWGDSTQRQSYDEQMSQNMADFFGGVDAWRELAGADNKLSRKELKTAMSDTTNYSPEQLNTLQYMRDNFREVKGSTRGDAMFKVTHADVLGWAKDHGASTSDSTSAPLRNDIESQRDQDMSANMLGFFGNAENFGRLSKGDNGISKYDLDEAKRDTARYSAAERATIDYMRDNFREIKSSNNDGSSSITMPDLIEHAANNDVTFDNIKPLGEQLLTFEPPVQNENVAPRPQIQEYGRVGSPNEVSAITIESGDTIFDIAKEKYGKGAWEAIYAFNGMSPTVEIGPNGSAVVKEPTYKVGEEIGLPPADQLERLTQAYKDRVSFLMDRHAPEETNIPQEKAEQPPEEQQEKQGLEVTLKRGDTFYELGRKLYGNDIPTDVLIKAIYQANNLEPRYVNIGNGNYIMKEPIYHAGQSYKLPPQEELTRLAQQYKNNYGDIQY